MIFPMPTVFMTDASSIAASVKRAVGLPDMRRVCMPGINGNQARAVADTENGQLLASVEIAAPPERVFRALASTQITQWWVRPGVFDTREWTGDVRVGGRWRAAGMTRGQAYVQEGEFLDIDSPRMLVHTWDGAGQQGAPSTVTYVLEPVDTGTRLTLRHAGFASREMCKAFAAGWETSFDELARLLA
jgi:uncharacterized protein YndB with AHSA1/START domain